MTTRKKVDEEKASAESAVVGQSQEPPRSWYTNKWGGAQHYNCSRCSYDTFDFSAMLQHVRFVHNVIPESEV